EDGIRDRNVTEVQTCALPIYIKYHYYSLNKLTLNNNPWTTGKIYIFPKSNFSPSDTGKIPFDEWICHDLVRPASQLEVSAKDFYYVNRVSTHKNNESIVKTLLLYKLRTLKTRQRKFIN